MGLHRLAVPDEDDLLAGLDVGVLHVRILPNVWPGVKQGENLNKNPLFVDIFPPENPRVYWVFRTPENARSDEPQKTRMFTGFFHWGNITNNVSWDSRKKNRMFTGFLFWSLCVEVIVRTKLRENGQNRPVLI